MLATVLAASFALVVTNNHSLEAAQPDLHYADDDGAQYAELFAELAGRDHVTLLTRFDADSAAVHPAWARAATPPTRSALTDAVGRLASRVAAAGPDTDVWIVYAGHGDVREGQGFVELEDGPVDAEAFDALVLAKLPPARVHLVFDSCNSYFMLYPRRPGGRRWESTPDETRSLFERHPGLGAIVATSAEQVTYEWSELQSGIFSYLVRSGLRGGADVDGDGRVSYGELAAFIRVASASVPNELYRPRVFVSPPKGDSRATFAVLPSTQRRLELPAGGDVRLTVRDDLGVRLADVHKEDGTAAMLMLPNGPLVVDEEERVGGRLEARRLAMPADGSASLASLAPSIDRPTARGSSPLFDALFSTPFGKVAFAKEQARPPEPQTFGVGERDVERLRLHLGAAATADRALLNQTGWTNVALGLFLGAVGVGLAQSLEPPERLPAYGIAGGTAALFLGFGALSLNVGTPEESLYRSFLAADESTPAARGRAVLDTERAFATAANDARLARRRGLYPFYAAAGAIVAFDLYDGGLKLATHQRLDFGNALDLVGAGAFVALGWLWSSTPSSVERSWDLYEKDVDLDGREPAPPKATPTTPGATSTDEPSPHRATGLHLTGLGLAPVQGGAMVGASFSF